MPDTLVKVALGRQDVMFHDPAAGSTQQTFSRDGEGGATITPDKIGTNSIPGLDPAYTAGGRGGFWELHGGSPTQANLHAESMLRLLRKQQRRVINVEGLGMIPNDASDAAGETNRRLWDDIMVELQGRGGTLYFPTVADGWYFKRPAADGGSKILPVYRYNVSNDRTPSDVVILGDGPGSRIKACPGAPKTDDLLHVRGRAISIVDIVVDRVVADASTNGVAARVDAAAAQPIIGLSLFNAQFLRGSRNFVVEHPGAAPSTSRNLLMYGCLFDGSWAENVYLQDLAGIIASQTRWAGRVVGVGGFVLAAAVAGDAMSDILLSDVSGSTGGDFIVRLDPGVAFNSAIHGRIKAHGVRPPGYFAVTDEDQVSLDEVTGGLGIQVQYTKPGVSFSKLRVKDARCTFAATGLLINVTGGAGLIDWMVRGGTFEACLGSGISVVATGAGSSVRKGRVGGVAVQGNGQSGPSAGMTLAATGGGVLTDTLVTGGHYYDLQGVPTQTAGIDEVGADWTLVDGNSFQGHSIAPHNITGPNSIIGTNIYR